MKRILMSVLALTLSMFAVTACQGSAVDESESEGEEGMAQSELLGGPVLFADCVAPGTDCCNPVCRPYISGCCVGNSCGEPVVSLVYGSGPFSGLSLVCSPGPVE